MCGGCNRGANATMPVTMRTAATSCRCRRENIDRTYIQRSAFRMQAGRIPLLIASMKVFRIGLPGSMDSSRTYAGWLTWYGVVSARKLKFRTDRSRPPLPCGRSSSAPFVVR